MKKLLVTIMALGIASLACAHAQNPQTMVFHGGTILTVDEEFSEAEAFAVRGNKILAVGSAAEVLKTAGDGAKKVDLEGRTILPAFIDPHFHVLSSAQIEIFEFIGLTRFKSVEEALAHIKTVADSDKAGDWLLFRDLDHSTQTFAGGEQITKEDLDALCDTKPMLVWHAGGHVATANSKMLEIVGGEATESNGVLYGMDIFGVVGKIEPYTKWDPVKGLAAGHREWLAMGLGTLGDTGTGPVTGGAGDWDALVEASESGGFPMRVRAYMSNGFEDSWRKANLKPGTGNDRVKLIGFKLSADGSNQAKTGLQRAPYVAANGSKGKAYLTQEEIDRQIQEWSKKGFQIAMHGNGGAGIDNIITGVRAAEKAGIEVKRPRIEHCSIVHNDQLVSIKELGLSASFLMGHVRYWGGALAKVMGEDRAKLLDRAGTFEKMKIPFSLHSDSPVISTSPLEMIEIAVTRNVVTRPGYTLAPKEKISVESAIRAVTITPAWQMLSEDQLGSIEAGKLADFVVLESDPRSVKQDQISEIKVMETWIDGNRVYQLEK